MSIKAVKISLLSFIDWDSLDNLQNWCDWFDYSGALDFIAAALVIYAIIKRLEGKALKRCEVAIAIVALAGGACWMADTKLNHRLSDLQSRAAKSATDRADKSQTALEQKTDMLKAAYESRDQRAHPIVSGVAKLTLIVDVINTNADNIYTNQPETLSRLVLESTNWTQHQGPARQFPMICSKFSFIHASDPPTGTARRFDIEYTPYSPENQPWFRAQWLASVIDDWDKVEIQAPFLGEDFSATKPMGFWSSMKLTLTTENGLVSRKYLVPDQKLSNNNILFLDTNRNRPLP